MNTLSYLVIKVSVNYINGVSTFQFFIFLCLNFIFIQSSD